MNKLSFNDLPGLDKRIKMALSSLGTQKPFATFNMKFSPDEKNSLNKIHINDTKSYDNFGNLDVLQDEAKAFIKSLGHNDTKKSESIANLITNLVSHILLAFEKETAWITIRASVATSEWDVPRWHSDGYYYSPDDGEQYKIAITLKGPSTLFYPLPEEWREKFNALQFNPENREKIAKMLDASKTISVDFEKGSIFIVGANHAAIHSEPKTHEERLFLSVVPGNKTQIEELYNHWHPKK